MLCALIMAGGIGSRFWPQSTEEMPKQFLKLLGDKTMIRMTYDRINKLIPSENIFIITNDRYVEKIKKELPELPDINIITEPCSKNTAPCILLSSLYIKNLRGEVNIACISSDSYIKKEDVFLEKIQLANDFVSKNKEALVTIGITPTRPETAYGYIKYNKEEQAPNKVEKFVEKPDLETAEEYLADGNYLWNAGMFIFNNINMIKEIEENSNNEYLMLKDLPLITDPYYKKFLVANYEKCNKISIDYAVMEKSKNVYTIPSDLGWDDVGSWKSLERYIPKDESDNIIKGEVKVIDSKNNVIYGNGKRIILLNVNDIFCIDSNDVIIIGDRKDLDKVQRLKD
jgi:mannose-1-phosphate guanylyltransferase